MTPRAPRTTQARVGRAWSAPPEGQDYVTRLRWDAPLRVFEHLGQTRCPLTDS